jgi:flagellin
MISIQTNVNSLIAQQNLNVNNEFQAKTIQQLTSGYRINRSGDDAAGLAVANQYRSSVTELTQGVSNGNNGVAQLQIMDGGMSNISQILDRLKTLATQSASGTLSGGDSTRTTLNGEFQTDLAEIDRQAQSIGLNTGGSFAKSLDVYLGQGSGSGTGAVGLQNGIVTLDLSKSSVDSQALGMMGMQSVGNLSNSIGPTSATSVQNIVSNTSGANANQEATTGYALLQFSGAGFSNAGKAQVSVNLQGVTDVATLVTAVNNAIQSTGQGPTSAATAFKNANIVASVNTDSNGGQELAFTSSTAAFQVQAGDQMGNALLGNVTAVSASAAQGTAVTGTANTTVTGAVTQLGTFGSTQAVSLTVTGGGLSGPVTLNLNDTAGNMGTTAAINDLETQFAGNASLQGAGLSMTGSSVVGNRLTFNSANGQSFNVQVTGDTQNLLGLGSFLTSAGASSYTSITGSGAGYSASTVTGSAATAGVAAGLEVSINGQASTALGTIDLTAGASATVATATNGSVGASAVDVTATNDNLNITVTNNGVVNQQVFSLTNTAQVATKATSTGTLTDTTYASSHASTVISAANNKFDVSLNGGAATAVTMTNGTYTTATDFLGAVNQALGNAGIAATATWGAAGGAGTGALTITTTAPGSGSTISLSQDLSSTKAAVSAGTLTDSNYVASTVISAAAHNNTFNLSVDGGTAQLVTIGPGTYTAASDFLTAVNAALSGKNVTATWGAAGGAGTGAMTFTSTSATSGVGSSVSVTASTYGSQAALTAGTLTNANYTASTVISAANNNNQFTISVDGGTAQNITIGPGTYTAASDFIVAVNTALNGKNVTATWGAVGGPGTGAMTFTSTSTTNGAASSVSVGQVSYNTEAAIAAGSLTDSVYTSSHASTVISSANDTFNVSINGGAATAVTITNGTYTTAADFIGAVNSAVTGVGLQATWGAVGGNGTGALTLTSTNAGVTGTSASVAVSPVTYNTEAALAAGTLTDSVYTASHSSTVISAANNKFTVSTDGGTATTVTITSGTYTTAADFIGAVNSAVTSAGLTATWGASGGPGTGALTLTSTNAAAKGTAASVTVGQVTANTAASLAAGTLTAAYYNANDASTVINSALHNNTFTVATDGGTATPVTIANGTYTTAADFISAVNSAVTGQGLQATWGAVGGAGTGALTLTSTGATSGTGASVTVGKTTYDTKAQLTGSTLTAATGAGEIVTAASNDQFNIAVDGGPAVTVAITAGTYTTADDFLSAITSALSTANVNNVTATWGTAGDDTGALTFTSTGTHTGASSSVSVAQTGSNTGSALLGYGGGTSAYGATVDNAGLTKVGLTDGGVGHGVNGVVNNGISVVGLTDGAVGNGLSNVSNAGITVVGLNGATAGHGLDNQTNAGLADVGMTNNAIAHGTDNALTNTGLTKVGLNGTTTQYGSASSVNAAWTLLGLNNTLGRGQNDVPSTLQSIATQIQAQFNGAATVSVSNTNQLIIKTIDKGANSSVTIGAPATNSANTLLNLTPGTITGANSSLADVVSNLNAQFAANSTYQAAGLTAAATDSSGGNTASNYLTISSNNGTQFRLNSLGGTATQTKADTQSTVTSANIVSSPITVTAGVNDQFKVAVDGGNAVTVTVGPGVYNTANGFLTAVGNAINTAGLSASVQAAWGPAGTGGALTLSDTSTKTGTASSLTLSAVTSNTGLAAFGLTAGANTGAQAAEDLGFGTSGSSFTQAALNTAGAKTQSTGTSMSTQLANGVSNTTAVDFTALQYGTDKQALTFSATDANGTLETKTITLQNNTLSLGNTAGANIDSAVAYINQQLQASTNMPALQQIVAVTQANGSGTAEQINFMSSLSNFTVGVGASANGTDGLNNGGATQLTSREHNTAANMSIGTQATAEQAITAITSAVAALGSAQAAVGKGENQLGYAINLAQSQITNFSAAQSQIRDADVAAQAANLSKAQVLQQSTIAAMAQANSAPQAVLSLLKG